MEERKHLYLFYKEEEPVTSKVENMKKLAEEQGFTIVDNHAEANIIASIGGDGAFLQAVRKSGFRDDCLYVGVGAAEDIGFYCDFHIDDLSGMLQAMNTAQIEVRRYPTLEVTVDGHSRFFCLNECSIRSSIIKTFVMDVFIDDLYFETFRGDGMLVSTPTGSTAYNKSVNGAVLDPMLACYQVSEMASLNNNNYRTLGSSFVLSSERKLSFKVSQDTSYPIIGIDNEALSVQHCESLEFSLSSRKVKTVKLKDNSFWHKVRRSFL